MKGVLPWLVREACRAGTRYFVLTWVCYSRPSTTYFFLTMHHKVTIYAPVIYTSPCIMFWRRGYTLRGELGGGWALEFPSFLGPLKW